MTGIGPTGEPPTIADSWCDTGRMPEPAHVPSDVPGDERTPPPTPPAAASHPTELEPVLPEPVRQRVVTLASTALTGMPVDTLPTPVRQVARFAPTRRARLGGTVIAAHLASDPIFLERVGAAVRTAHADLAAALDEGRLPAAVDPVEAAAVAYLTRPPGWADLVGQATDAVRADAATAATADRLAAAEHRAARAEHERVVAKQEADKLRDELERNRAETSTLKDEVRALGRGLREAQTQLQRTTQLLATEKGRAARAVADSDAESRRLKARLAEAEAAASGARARAKDSRAVDDARLWLLLETIGQAAIGLRRELALEPASLLPADHVAQTAADTPDQHPQQGARALDADDPARLDQLLALPKSHLIVDGYNVTKRGFGEISLEQQRRRLISSLSGVHAQSRAEVTVVFDGADPVAGLPSHPRGVRVLFSRKGETADELIRELVRAEPAGRPIVVVSSDKEVADGVRRHGAYPLSSDTLLRRIARV